MSRYVPPSPDPLELAYWRAYAQVLERELERHADALVAGVENLNKLALANAELSQTLAEQLLPGAMWSRLQVRPGTPVIGGRR